MDCSQLKTLLYCAVEYSFFVFNNPPGFATFTTILKCWASECSILINKSATVFKPYGFFDAIFLNSRLWFIILVT